MTGAIVAVVLSATGAAFWLLAAREWRRAEREWRRAEREWRRAAEAWEEAARNAEALRANWRDPLCDCDLNVPGSYWIPRCPEEHSPSCAKRASYSLATEWRPDD